MCVIDFCLINDDNDNSNNNNNNNNNVPVLLTKHHTVKTLECGGIAPRILDLGI
jgi:hypothetical protein